MKSVTLFVVLASVAATFVHSCNAATSSLREMKLENERVLKQKAVMSNLAAVRARQEAGHAYANRPRSMPAATQKHSEAKSASAVETETVVDKVRFDTDSIVEDAKKAAKRAMNLPSSFKDWENRMKQKMAAMKANSRRKEVSTTKTDVQNKEDKKISVASSTPRYANPTLKELLKEIEVEGKTPDTDAAPYLMPIKEMSQQAAKTMSSHGPVTSPRLAAARKNLEDKLQAHIEEMKANPQQWKDVERRVEAMEMKEAKKMSSRGPLKTVTLPLVDKEEWNKKAQARVEELKATPRKWEEVERRVEAMEMPAPRRLTPLRKIRPNGPQYPNF